MKILKMVIFGKILDEELTEVSKRRVAMYERSLSFYRFQYIENVNECLVFPNVIASFAAPNLSMRPDFSHKYFNDRRSFYCLSVVALTPNDGFLLQGFIPSLIPPDKICIDFF